jgi:flagellar protein FlaJ
MVSFDILSYRIFGKFAKKYSKSFESIDDDLKRSGMSYTLDEWLSIMFFVALLVLPLAGIGLYFLMMSVTGLMWEAIPFAVVGGLIVTGLVTVFLYIYPAQVSNSRKKRIENSLHFAAIYMATLAETGIPPYKIFNVLEKFEEFGEMSDISRNIVRDIEVFGLDFNEALERAANNAPLKELRDLLWGMRATIMTGGNLSGFLSQRSKALTNRYRRKLEGYVKSLSLFLEIYITVVIVGSVFVLVLTTIMSILGGSVEQIKLIQLIMVTIGLPTMSVIFIIILKTISPTEV